MACRSREIRLPAYVRPQGLLAIGHTPISCLASYRPVHVDPRPPGQRPCALTVTGWGNYFDYLLSSYRERMAVNAGGADLLRKKENMYCAAVVLLHHHPESAILPPVPEGASCRAPYSAIPFVLGEMRTFWLGHRSASRRHCQRAWIGKARNQPQCFIPLLSQGRKFIFTSLTHIRALIVTTDTEGS